MISDNELSTFTETPTTVKAGERVLFQREKGVWLSGVVLSTHGTEVVKILRDDSSMSYGRMVQFLKVQPELLKQIKAVL